MLDYRHICKSSTLIGKPLSKHFGTTTLTQTDYAQLSPDTVLDAVESLGYLSNLNVLALNSYENRVYQIGIEEGEPLIAKFYRPERWSDEQILEEHALSQQFDELEIPVIAPIELNGTTLFNYQGYKFSLYPRRWGHAPELENLDTLHSIGQLLGRMHTAGQSKPFVHRPTIDIESFGHQSRQYILDNKSVPDSLRESYSAISKDALMLCEEKFKSVEYSTLRLHGDCHPGNILVRDSHIFIVDLDDARSGPAVQDIWMLLSGDMNQKREQLATIVEGYEEFCDLSYAEFRLIESLRTLRMIHYAAWLSKRWSDPAFPKAFPWFASDNFWANHILELREQFFELQTPSISLQPY